MRAFAGIFAAVAAFAACAVFADGEQQKVDDLERKIREMEERIAQANKKAEDAAAQARELGAKAEEFKRTAGERGRVFNDQRGRADREQDRHARAQNDQTYFFHGIPLVSQNHADYHS